MEEFNLGQWQNYADCYDALNHLLPYRELMTSVTKQINTLTGIVILNAACGTGNFEEHLNKYENKNFKITSLDFSTEMIALAKRKKFLNAINFQRADLNKKLSLADNCFDIAVSINTLYALHTPQKTIKEFWRVLKSEGRLLLVTPKKGFNNNLIFQKHCQLSGFDIDCSKINIDSIEARDAANLIMNSEELGEKIITLAKINSLIAQEKKFHFFSKDELLTIIATNGFIIEKMDYVYANQSIFIVAKKIGGEKNDPIRYRKKEKLNA